MAALTSVVVAVAVGLLTFFYRARWQKGRQPRLLKLPLIGDLHRSPLETPLANWDAWTRHHGPVTVARLFGIIPIVVLNSFEAATELFSRRSPWYSNRPASVSMEMITGAEPGRSRFTLMHDYDEHLKLHHRILAPSLGALAAARYQPVMELESTQLLFDLCHAVRQTADGTISTTTTIYPLLERTQSSVILALHYGRRVSSGEDSLLHEILETQAKVTHLAANPGLPDLLPPLRHLPAFLSPWKRAADQLFATQTDLYLRLFRQGRDTPGWNATKQALSTAQKYTPVPDLDLAFTLATSIQGGMETSPRQLLWLFIAMLHQPTMLARSHAALDAVVGRNRLPRFADRARLPMIDAIAHELFRWRPVSPGSIPRRADRDDDFQGVPIAKGVTVMANAWAIGRDASVFDPARGDLDDFVPDRWLRSDEGTGTAKLRTDLPLPVFGQGRRICQGKRVATDGMFMQVASLLWAFEIEPAEGAVVDPWAMTVVGFMTMPSELRVRLNPRGPWVGEVIQEAWETAEKSLETVMGPVEDVEGDPAMDPGRQSAAST
ncbi:putative cytochrome P450 [Aspergillus ibericus CBS 121593]|uniref:Putative cytochrome P450 n=1 Tax=Aspergillus ibericus CBS 121593 TaxID=1448316 RepID=A0A395GXJ2_9EURO|nr:putative cytochrome P450 [Aspergillus ibericus CBS 121593]RAK99407.1 putative cytochrome P450 [Aspergillus ibericus CBS 121593]